MRGHSAAGFALVAVAVAAIGVLVAVGPLQARQDRPVAGPVPGPATAAYPRLGPAIPASGAYLGAYVNPVTYSQRARINRVKALQRQIGRRLDVVNRYLRAWARFPTPSDRAYLRQGSMLMVSWGLSDTRGIRAGAYDRLIRRRAAQMKALRKPIFLRLREEMDRPNLRYLVHSGPDFIAAWKHVRAIFARRHVANVAWVWCPTSRGFASGHANAFYPGDHQVDWVCTDVYPGPGHYRSFADVADPFLAWASRHRKPVMIGEFGVPQSYPPPQRARWLRAAAHTVRADPQVKVFSYFDGGGPDLGFFLDTPAVIRAFRSIAHARYFNPRGLPITS